ncbi:MAG: 4Fe-4S dicluster domain-containing protein [Syntrophorhabdaceae bacterium]|nr:4Fe-4S dicluster domain-containing protein [Syntrophorhabdaceae bacterium]
MTEYRGKDEISIAINSFFRANPLVVVSFILSAKSFVLLLLPGLLMIFFSAILGRFFCGWICPLGTIIDFLTRRIKKTTPLSFLKTRLKYYLLLILLTSALFNVNIAGIFDPIAILLRALTFFIYPLFGWIIKSGWTGLYNLIGDRRDYLDFFYVFLKDYVLPFRETFYPLAFISMAFLFFIIFLERYETRNWCRNICPLGTLLGILAKFSIIRRIPSKLCNDCGTCKEVCPTGFDTDILQKQDCILCMDCRWKCQFKRIDFSLKGNIKKEKKPTIMFERRVLITGVISGFGLSKLFSFIQPQAKERLLRPPGVQGEGDFLKKCVRCGECIKVCLKNALYPSGLQWGIYSIFTPVIIPRLGYCEYNCNLCGQVCPTGAIPNLPLPQKKKSVIGIAVIDRNHCLPYAKKKNCIVCEEHCPIPEKAIRFEEVLERDYRGRSIRLKRPYILEELCTGCGICENKCPVEEKAAIEVFSRNTNIRK